MLLSKMNRAEMEVEVLINDIGMPNGGTSEELAEVSALSDEALRARIGTWIEEGSEV